MTRLAMFDMYPKCTTTKDHHFEVREPVMGMFGNTFTYCTGCGLTPKQLLDIRTAWNKNNIKE